MEEYSARGDLVYSVMPQRKEFIEQRNKSLKMDKRVVEGAGNLSMKKFHHSTNISSGEGDRSTNKKRA